MDKGFIKVTILVFTIIALLLLGIYLRINYMGVPSNQNIQNETVAVQRKVLGQNTDITPEPTSIPMPKKLSDNEIQIIQNLISDLLKQPNQLDSDELPSSEILNNQY